MSMAGGEWLTPGARFSTVPSGIAAAEPTEKNTKAAGRIENCIAVQICGGVEDKCVEDVC